MGVKPATFAVGSLASQHYIPGAYSRMDFVRSAGGNVSINNAAILGDCRSGQPNKLLWFDGAADAISELKSGTLLDAVIHAFNPGGGLAPQRIAAVRVNPGTQAARVLNKSATAEIDVTSGEYGLFSNKLKLKFTRTGSAHPDYLYHIELQNDADPSIKTENIQRKSFLIRYTAASGTCSMTITKTGLTTTTGTPSAPAEDLSITFSSFETVAALVAYIDNHAAYTCTLMDTGGSLSEKLDSVTAVDVKTADYVAVSNLEAIIEALDNHPLVGTAAFRVGTSLREVPDVDATLINFAGAVDGAYTSSEWGASLTFLEGEDIQLVGASSSDNAVHALILAHCVSMNGINGKSERQFIIGGADGETTAQVIARQLALSSEFGAIAYPGFTGVNNITGEQQAWSPVYLAAKLIGMTTCLSLNEPLTNKVIGGVTVWTKKLTVSEQNQMISAGVMCGIKARDQRNVVLRSMTTYGGDELQKCEFSMMREALFISRDLRDNLERSIIGNAMTQGLLGSIDSICGSKLAQYRQLGLFNGSPPYWGYKRTVNGDQVKVEFDCYLTPPMNFMFIVSHMNVFSSIV